MPKIPEPVFIFWAADGEHIRLWTKDRFRALRFATDSGVEAQIYVPAEDVAAAWQKAIERCAEVCEAGEPPLKRGGGRVEIGSMAREAFADAIRALTHELEKRHG